MAAREFVRSEAIGIAALGFFALVALIAIPQELVQDSWLALVAGREVVDHGLPDTDSLNIWTEGARWVDQQWLSQTTLYGLVSVGGIRLAMLAHVAFLTATLGIAFVAARRLGGTTLSTSLLMIATVLVAPWALQVRPQTAAMPLFVVLLWLLARDSRDPSRLVYLTLPILAIWANVHGTVIMGAALVTVRGLTLAFGAVGRGGPALAPRAAVLTLAPLVCTLATPYGLSIVGYYEDLLFNPLLREYVVEWKASTPSADTAAFYAYAGVAGWLGVRQRRLLTPFERVALALTLLGGFLAVRSILWFALTGLLLLPRLLDRELPQLRPLPGSGRLKEGLAVTTVAAVAAVALAVATRGDSWFTQEWPLAAAAQVAPSSSTVDVLSDERYADWLLWERPELRGRIAYGVRFELFDEKQFATIEAFKRADADGWQQAANGYDVLVLDRRVRSSRAESQLAADGYAVVYRDDEVVVLRAARSTTATSSSP